MRDKLIAGLAEILETPALSPSTVLLETNLWDSMSLVSTIALIDDVTGRTVDGERLAAAVSVSDVLALAGCP